MIDYWEVANDRRKLRKQVKILRAFVTDFIGPEGCAYMGHDGDTTRFDPECPGSVCWAKRALREARAVR